MTPTELKARLDEGARLALLDVREDDERAYCSIKLPETAVDLHIPLGEVADRAGEIAEKTAGMPLVVLCHHGMRSQAAATWLTHRGQADVHNLDGGIDAWTTQVDPSVPRY
ncbi:rhodanese-like domain-containing protein [Tundrisphaera sp. TA3]|uniref:rhodanese-like domain-containing protein n=1 Tax=Tundrisphaera sp. TA3 TaxID=3435775 RepID=UPI003EBC9802